MTTRDSVLELKNRICSSITGQDQAGSDLQRNNLNGGLVGAPRLFDGAGAGVRGRIPESIPGISAAAETGSFQSRPSDAGVTEGGVPLGPGYTICGKSKRVPTPNHRYTRSVDP